MQLLHHLSIFCQDKHCCNLKVYNKVSTFSPNSVYNYEILIIQMKLSNEYWLNFSLFYDSGMVSLAIESYFLVLGINKEALHFYC